MSLQKELMQESSPIHKLPNQEKSAMNPLATVATGGKIEVGRTLDRMHLSLSAEQAGAVAACLARWHADGKICRFWAGDSSLRAGNGEGQWCDWLGIAPDRLAYLGHLRQLAQEVKDAGFSHVLLVDMGGSNPGPEVLRNGLAAAPGFPELLVLDATDPAEVRPCRAAIAPVHTLCIVSSSFGSTLEPDLFKQYFFVQAVEKLGLREATRRFVAINDPGSRLVQVAASNGFAQVSLGLSTVGGKHPMLSDGSLVPAALLGADIPHFLAKAEEMVHSCAADVPAERNPGVLLGTVLGVLAANGRNRAAIFASPAIASLGQWLWQWLAESTGRQILPVAGAHSGATSDRLFIYLRLESAPDPAQDAAVAALEAAGQPVVQIEIATPDHIGQELMRWEMATAAARVVLGSPPFVPQNLVAAKR
jgi:transaldolase/glucose-6-phosphate isomerase